VNPEIVGMTAKKLVDLPEQFGRYRILKLLGRGGMGAVYLARDEDLHREVALKVPRIDFDDTPQALERFYQEARAAAAFRHPNICPVYEVGEIDGIHYLTMAFIDGKSLIEVIKSGALMSQRKIADLIRKIALALEEAHRNGVIHRDIKSANIMINSRNEPIVMDFGLARRNKPGDARITQSGTIMGSPAYMSPEQVRDLMTAGPACDIYSLGVVLYELLARRLPFLGAPMEVISQLLLDPPPTPSKFRPDVDPALEAICLKALGKKPEDRHPSMGKMAAELLAYLKGELPLPVPAVVEPAAITETFPPQPKEQPLQPDDMGGVRSMIMAYREGLADKPSRPRMPGKAAPRPPEQGKKRAQSATTQRYPWLPIGVGSAVGLILFVVGLLVWIGSKHASPNQATSSTTPSQNSASSTNPSPPIDKTPEEKTPETIGAGTKPPDTPPLPREFRPLFNGKDLAGWVEEPKLGVWKAGNNELSYSAGNQVKEHGWLLTDGNYGDFVLRLEFKVTGAANSSVGLRMSPRPGANYLAVQIRNDRAPRFAKSPDTRKTGALYNLAVSRPAPLKPPGSWNSMEIELRGVWLRVRVNGVETCLLPLDCERVVKHLGAAAAAVGRIGLQSFGGSVSFRNIAVKENFSGAPLPPPGLTPPNPSSRWAIDLQAKANQQLIESMGSSGDALPIRVGNHVSPIQGIPFQIGKGLIRVGSTTDNSKPFKVNGIKVGAAFRTLHIIHAASGAAPRGTLIGSYVVHYADGTQTTIPILIGIDVGTWLFGPKSGVPAEGKVAWSGFTRKKGGIRIFQSKWSNPKPEVLVETIDFVSAETNVSPFVLAMTRES
jgi:serine/threonine protein kinase